MPPKSYSWAQVDVKQPNARVVTFGDFEIMVPKSTCYMLTHRELTSIEAWCQAAHPFGHYVFLQPYPIQVGCFQADGSFPLHCYFLAIFLLSIKDASDLQNLHRQRSIIDEVTSVPPQRSLPGIEFLFDLYFYGFSITDECTFFMVFACVFYMFLSKSILYQSSCGFGVYVCLLLAF